MWDKNKIYLKHERQNLNLEFMLITSNELFHTCLDILIFCVNDLDNASN